MNRDALIAKLGEVLAGLQVPLSIAGPQMLGAACEPYREVLHSLPGAGWRNAEDFEVALHEALDA